MLLVEHRANFTMTEHLILTLNNKFIQMPPTRHPPIHPKNPSFQLMSVIFRFIRMKLPAFFENKFSLFSWKTSTTMQANLKADKIT